jgi:predicted DNA-binding protein
MSDPTLVLTLPAEVRERLDRLSAEIGRTPEECVRLAVDEFIESWEDHLRTVAAITEGNEERPVLRPVDD